MKRGDTYYANLSPAVGSEMGKRRPVLIVSNDTNNRPATIVTILPITSNVSRVYPFEVELKINVLTLTKFSARLQVNHVFPT